MFWILIEFLVLVVVATFFATQLIVPLWKDRPLFPAFRRGIADDLDREVKHRLENERHLREVLQRRRELDDMTSENLRESLSFGDAASALEEEVEQ